jgi:hypothetical protein
MVTGPTGGSVEGVPCPYQQGGIPHPTMYIAIRRVVWKLRPSISKSASKMYISKNGGFKVEFGFEVCKSTWVLSTSHTNQVGFVYIRGSSCSQILSSIVHRNGRVMTWSVSNNALFYCSTS